MGRECENHPVGSKAMDINWLFRIKRFLWFIYKFYHDLVLLWRETMWLLRDLVINSQNENPSLVNKRYIREYLNFDSMYADTHGSDENEFLGAGLLYYSLAYMNKAKLCVCLGSGGGFVPRMMNQAQRDLGLKGARTILVDAIVGPGISYLIKTVPIPKRSFFSRKFPEIEIINDLTSNVAQKYRDSWRIDYLHIDADHSFEGCLKDFYDYKDLMSPDGIITFHDTNNKKVGCRRVLEIIINEGHEVVNFPNTGAGVAVIKLLNV